MHRLLINITRELENTDSGWLGWSEMVLGIGAFENSYYMLIIDSKIWCLRLLQWAMKRVGKVQAGNDVITSV